MTSSKKNQKLNLSKNTLKALKIKTGVKGGASFCLGCQNGGTGVRK